MGEKIARRVTTQDISWFLDLHANGQLELNPPYQRRSVWSPSDRQFFLDTVLRGFPSPSIFLHKAVVDGKTTYYVVDGKQRLETVLKFHNNRMKIPDDFGDEKLNGKNWKDIVDNPDLSGLLYDYVFPVEFINVTSGANYVNEVFDRLNRNSRKLTDQELRHAKYEGWFISFVENEASEKAWHNMKITTTSREKRMKNIQFLSELLMVVISGEVRGFDQGDIDQFYADYDDPNLLEDEGTFEPDQIILQFSEVRDFIHSMLERDVNIAPFLKDFKDIYTLWTCIALNPELRNQDILKITSKYRAFMEIVAGFQSGELSSHNENPNEYKYYDAARGASTDKPQRQARYESLLESLK